MASDPEIFHDYGPLFDGKAEELLHKATAEIEQKIAEKARDKVRDRLLSKIKVEVSGAEPASIHVEEDERGKIVTDRHEIAYGPWLEGVGSRNGLFRFKGYHTFRIVAGQIRREAKADAEEVLDRYIEEMNV